MSKPYQSKPWLRDAILDAGGFADVASACNVTPAHLYNLTNGHRPITRLALAAMRRALPDVTPDQWWQAVDDDAASDIAS